MNGLIESGSNLNNFITTNCIPAINLNKKYLIKVDLIKADSIKADSITIQLDQKAQVN